MQYAEQRPSYEAECNIRKGKACCCCLFFNGPATEAEPQIIIIRENEVHICKGEERKVVKEIKSKERERERRETRRNTEGGEERRNKGRGKRVRNESEREIPLHL